MNDQLTEANLMGSETKTLSRMLQESHKSLIESNQLLIREIEELRVNHAQETVQWQRNFNEIKKLVQITERKTET